MSKGVYFCVVVCLVGGFAQRSYAHAWGATSRSRTLAPERCTPTELPVEMTFLKALFARLATGNPEVFVGEYAPENFCIEVVQEDRAYARTRAEALHIRLSTGLLRKARSTDEIAAVLAHELAHATLQHLEWDFEHPSYRHHARWRSQRARVAAVHARLDVHSMAENYARLTELAAYVNAEAERRHPEVVKELKARMQTEPQARDAYEALLRQTAADMPTPEAESYLALRDWEARQQALTEQWFAERQRLQAIEDEILGERHASLNWREQEADEVAWEFLWRAGFASDSLERALRHTLTFEAPTLEQCLERVQSARSGADVTRPERGAGAHPRPCWRLFHAAVTMPTDHPHASTP